MQTTPRHRGLKPALALLVIGSFALPLAGCAPDPQQVQVERGSDASAGLTALQRGQIRGEALTDTKKGMDAWLRNDVDGMRPYWDTQYIDTYTKSNAEYAAAGITRVRKLDKIDTYDVTDMNATGTEVIVDMYFNDASYTTDAKGTVVTKPTNKPTQFQLTVKKRDDTWVITRIIGAAEVLK